MELMVPEQYYNPYGVATSALDTFQKTLFQEIARKRLAKEKDKENALKLATEFIGSSKYEPVDSTMSVGDIVNNPTSARFKRVSAQDTNTDPLVALTETDVREINKRGYNYQVGNQIPESVRNKLIEKDIKDKSAENEDRDMARREKDFQLIDTAYKTRASIYDKYIGDRENTDPGGLEQIIWGRTANLEAYNAINPDLLTETQEKAWAEEMSSSYARLKKYEQEKFKYNPKGDTSASLKPYTIPVDLKKKMGEFARNGYKIIKRTGDSKSSVSRDKAIKWLNSKGEPVVEENIQAVIKKFGY